MSELFATAAAVTVAAIGAAVDLRTGRIPNVLTGTAAAAAFVLAVSGLGHLSPGLALAGGLAGLALMLPGYAFGATGAGDVKLVAALGTLVGPRQVGLIFLCTAIAGGALAIVHACRRGRLGITVVRTAGLVAAPVTTKRQIDAAADAARFAYGPAIALGAVAAAFWN